MKTKEELNAIKKEVEALNKKLRELTDDELNNVSSGACYSSGVALTEDVFGSDLSKCLFFEGQYRQKLDLALSGYCSTYKSILESL